MILYDFVQWNCLKIHLFPLIIWLFNLICDNWGSYCSLCGDGHSQICSIVSQGRNWQKRYMSWILLPLILRTSYSPPASVPPFALSCHPGWEDATLCCVCLLLLSQIDDCIVLVICSFENMRQRDNAQNQTPWWRYFYNSRSLHIIPSFYLWSFDFTLKIHWFSAK